MYITLFSNVNRAASITGIATFRQILPGRPGRFISGHTIRLRRHISMDNSILRSIFSSAPAPSRTTSHSVQKSDDEWHAVLSPEQFRVLRTQGTEPEFSHAYYKLMPDAKSSKTFNCAGCEAPLYKAQHKFKAHCGWPAFFDALPGAVVQKPDRMRTEIVCANCGGHLGHIFKGEGYETPTDERHCVNGISINFGESKSSKV